MSRKRSKHGPLVAALLLGAAAIGSALFFKPYPALEDKALLRSDDKVGVAGEGEGLAFIPAQASSALRKTTGLVFYGAAGVPPEAYAYLARACALAGYTAVLASAPLNFPPLAPSRASLAATSHPEVARWVLAGHALGGRAAALYAARPGSKAAGLLLLASGLGGVVDLSTKSLPVVTVSASRDALESHAGVRADQGRLPEGSRYVEISGGNHAQFGEYGPQPGDGVAEIPGPTQRGAVVEEALALLGAVDAGAGK